MSRSTSVSQRVAAEPGSRLRCCTTLWWSRTQALGCFQERPDDASIEISRESGFPPYLFHGLACPNWETTPLMKAQSEESSGLGSCSVTPSPWLSVVNTAFTVNEQMEAGSLLMLEIHLQTFEKYGIYSTGCVGAA